jgi:DNA polymerase III subunit gamma/tau
VAHTALARSYRPRRFADVATQEHVSETLRRAVSGGRVGHAYLFCGPRGVGKTTLARVLAMALNCQSRDDDGEPCGECESCTRIWSGTTSLDVVEIDAASNRGVDDARDLRSRAMYAPSEEGRFKVYIVDEAHMLTREAWNALLKVLEEPPDRVIFIFATTEPEKIEQTAAPILSRCQRFDFRRIGVADIVHRLAEVLEREGSEAPEDALRLIARKADGGMRDALSLTDQVLALSDGHGVSLAMVRRILGVVEEERFLHLLDLISARDRGGIFQLVQELLDQGYDLVEFYHGLLDTLRVLLRLRVGDPVAELPEEGRPDWIARAELFEPGDLVRMLGMAADLETGGSLRRSSQPRVLLELLLLRFSYLDRTVDLEALLKGFGGHEADPPPVVPSRRTAAPVAPTPRPPVQVPDPTPKPPSSPAPTPPSSRARRPEADEPNTGPAPSSEPRSMDVAEGWKAFLSRGEGIPPGLTPLLMGAEVEEVKPDHLRLLLPPGPALDRLGDPKELQGLEEGLAHITGGAPTIEVVARDIQPEPGEDRVSRGQVREGQLGDLLEKEPGLRGAVEGWDLDIVE